MSEKHRLLTADEEIDLAMRMEAGRDAAARLAAGESDSVLVELVADGQAARDALVLHNMRLVHKIARKFYSQDFALSHEDMAQEGVIGLMMAADKFDWRQGNRFSTVATWWIRQVIARQRVQSGTIRLPIHTGEKQQPKSAAIRQAMKRARNILEVTAHPAKAGRFSNYACGNPLRWRLTDASHPS
jgi:RNA polymerase primary sigma factor